MGTTTRPDSNILRVTTARGIAQTGAWAKRATTEPVVLRVEPLFLVIAALMPQTNSNSGRAFAYSLQQST